MGVRCVSLEVIVSAGKNVVDAVKSRMYHQCGGDPAARRHACEHECCLDVFGVAVPCSDARRLLSRIIEQPAHLLCVQVCGAARCGCRAKNARNGMGALMAVIPKFERAEADGHAWPDVVAESHSAQKACSVNAELFTSRQRGRNDRAARMRL